MSTWRHAALDGRVFVLDTGPLLDFLPWEADLCEEFPHVRRKLVKLKVQSDVRRFGQVLQRGHLLTVPGVFGEIHAHVLKLERDPWGRRRVATRFWNIVPGWIRTSRLREEQEALQDLPGDQLRDLGPVDATLLAVARKDTRPARLLVTAERTLLGKATALQIDSRGVEDFLSAGVE